MDMIGWLVAFVILIGIEAATMALTTTGLRAGLCSRFLLRYWNFRAVAACGVPDRIVCPSSLYKTARYPVRQPGDREDECGQADRKKGKVIKKSTTMSRPEPLSSTAGVDGEIRG